MDEIVVNGVTYVKKITNVSNYKIVRTQSAGVFAGVVTEINGRNCTVVNARRLWYWDGAASLSQLAMEGVKRPQNCKFPCEVTQIILTNVIEILDCTEKAMKSIGEVQIWAE